MNSSTQKKKHGYKYRRSWYLRAIVIDQVDGRTFGRGPYHNIRHNNWSINGFMQTMKQHFPGATHVNFYDYKGHYQFQERYAIQEQVPNISAKRSTILQVRYYNCYFLVTGEDRRYNDVIFAQFDL